jgi:hypothetical protein
MTGDDTPSAPARGDNLDADIAAAGLVPCGECSGKGYLGDDPEEPCVACGMTGFLPSAPAPRAGPAEAIKRDGLDLETRAANYLEMTGPRAAFIRAPLLVRDLLAAWRAEKERADGAELVCRLLRDGLDDYWTATAEGDKALQLYDSLGLDPAPREEGP